MEEKKFDHEQYASCLRRLRYDDRDVIMYENMLNFLWEYVIRPGCVENYQDILQEYSRWNLQMIEKCFYHLPHDLPYANIRRAYQSIVHLLDGNVEAGIAQLKKIGVENFSYDGKAPKLLMIKNGRRFQPVSKLFLLYNYYKVLKGKNLVWAEKWKKEFPYAFTKFGDEEHQEHDQFLTEQLETFGQCIFYPIFERIYKLPWCPADFYLYFEEGKSIPLSKLDFFTVT